MKEVCTECSHQKVCSHKSKYAELHEKAKELKDKEVINPFKLSLECIYFVKDVRPRTLGFYDVR